MASDRTAHFEQAEKLAKDPARVRRRFWRKLKGLAVKLPFAEDLLAAYYCAFDRDTPRHVQATLLGAIAYFVLPIDAIPDVLPVLGFTDDAAVLAGTLKLVAAHISDDHRAAARARIARLLGDRVEPVGQCAAIDDRAAVLQRVEEVAHVSPANICLSR